MLIAFASIKGTEGNSTLKEAVRSIEPEKSASLQRALDPVLLTAQGVSLGVKSAQRHTDFTDIMILLHACIFSIQNTVGQHRCSY